MTYRMRHFAYPEPGDTLSAFAAREFPGDDAAMDRLLSFNLHLVIRRQFVGAPQRGTNDPDLLPTDIVYLEAPLA
jgi:hypothetical protein